jgi:ribosomal protein S27AE
MSKQRENFIAAAGSMYDELMAWRQVHGEASIDEIIGQVTPQRRELMGELVAQLALVHGNGATAVGKACAQCGEEMVHKGQNEREVLHGEGQSGLKRTYYYCPRCKSGVFPPG